MADRWRVGVRWTARVTVLAFSLATLVLARFGVPSYVLFPLVAVSLLVLWAVDSRSGSFGLWAAYVVAFVLFADLRTLADDTGIAIKGHYALQMEKGLFGGAMPSDWLQHQLYGSQSPGALEFACVAVYTSYFIVPHMLALVLWLRDSAAFVRYGLAVLLTVYAGLLVSVLVPTAPPWLADRFAGGPHVHRIFADVLGHNPEQAGSQSGVDGTNPFAAMPSLHLAVTTLVVLALWRRPRLRWFAIVYAAAMAFALVYTGEHYVVDELAGVFTACLAWVAAARLVALRAKRAAVTEPTVGTTTITEPARGPA